MAARPASAAATHPLRRSTQSVRQLLCAHALRAHALAWRTLPIHNTSW
jgi:hypothetical protein